MSAVLKACFAYRNSVILFRRSSCVASNVRNVSQFIYSNRRLRRAKWSIQLLCNTNVQIRCLSLTAIKLNATNNVSNENLTSKASNENANSSSTTTADTGSAVTVDSTATSNVTTKEVDINSLANTNTSEVDLRDFIIPEPPSVPHYVEIPEHLLTSGDIGLTWYLPTGWIFNALEWLHQYTPWWGSIAIFTFFARVLLFPVFIYSQRKTTHLANVAPKIQELQQKVMEAQRSGNQLELIKQINKLAELMHGKDFSRGKMMFNSLALPLSTGFIMMSNFIALREMSKYPIESMKCGGLAWFEDLTVMDPTWGLPLLAALSVYGVAKMGTEFGTQLMTNNWGPKLVQFGAPPVMFFLTWAFSIPNSVLLYMITSNIFSLGQVWLINQQTFRAKFKLPQRKITTTKQEPFSLQNSIESMKAKFTDIKESTVGTVDHRKTSKITFEKAGIGPIQKTYKYDPTKISKRN